MKEDTIESSESLLGPGEQNVLPDQEKQQLISNDSLKGLILVILSACSASFLGGYNSGVVAGALLFIVPEFGLEDMPRLEGLITSIGVIGGICGIMFALPMFGRKIPLSMASLIYILAAALMFWSPNVYVLIVGRFFVGYGGGMAGVNLPLYTAECSPTNRRGFVVSSAYVVTVVGVLVSYIVDFCITLTSSTEWRWMVGASIFPSTLMLILVSMLPESPRYLVSRLRFSQARAVLERLRNSKNIDDEFQAIVTGIFPQVFGPLVDGVKPVQTQGKDNSSLNAGSQSSDLNEKTPLVPSLTNDEAKQPFYQILLDKTARKALLTCILLEFFQQWSGIQAVIVYTPTILKESGVSIIFEGLGISEESSSLLATMLVYCVKIPFLFMGMTWIDRIGRRAILLLTVPFMALSLAGVASSFLFPDDDPAGAIMSFVFIMVYGCAYSPGLGSVPTLIESEIFPPAFRSLGLSICAFFGAVFNVFIIQAFPSMKAYIGLDVTFFIFAGISAIAFFFIYFFIPETKRITLEDTYKVLNQSPTEPS